MEEDLSVINTNTKIEKIKNLLIDNKKLFISLIVLFILENIFNLTVSF